jgi:hypothetical protein
MHEPPPKINVATWRFMRPSKAAEENKRADEGFEGRHLTAEVSEARQKMPGGCFGV